MALPCSAACTNQKRHGMGFDWKKKCLASARPKPWTGEEFKHTKSFILLYSISGQSFSHCMLYSQYTAQPHSSILTYPEHFVTDCAAPMKSKKIHVKPRKEQSYSITALNKQCLPSCSEVAVKSTILRTEKTILLLMFFYFLVTLLNEIGTSEEKKKKGCLFQEI